MLPPDDKAQSCGGLWGRSCSLSTGSNSNLALSSMHFTLCLRVADAALNNQFDLIALSYITVLFIVVDVNEAHLALQSQSANPLPHEDEY